MDTRAQGPDIALRGVNRELRRLPRGRAHYSTLPRLGLGRGQAEVGKDEVWIHGTAAAGLEEDVRGLDVAVHDGLEVLRRPRAVVGEAIIARVDVGEGVGELHVGVPDEGFWDLGPALGVRVDQVLEVALGAPFVPERGAGRRVSVGLQVDDAPVAIENLHEDGCFSGHRAGALARVSLHDLTDKVFAVARVLIEVTMTLAADTDVPNELVGLVLDVAVGRVVGVEVDDCSLTRGLDVKISAGISSLEGSPASC